MHVCVISLLVDGLTATKMRRVAPPVALCAFSVDGDYILQDFGGEDASHLSKEDFEKLRSGEEERLLLGSG